MRINVQYKNTGSSAVYFQFDTQTVGDTQGEGGRISTVRTKVEPNQESSHIHWIRMWSEGVTERNWLLSSSSETGSLIELERRDFRVNLAITTTSTSSTTTSTTSTSSTSTSSTTQPGVNCICDNSGQGAPNNHFKCTDGDSKYCASDEICYGTSVKPQWPCRVSTITCAKVTSNSWRCSTKDKMLTCSKIDEKSWRCNV